MFKEELAYKTQSVVGWNLKPDILIHGSPCQVSIAGHQGKATADDGRVNRGKVQIREGEHVRALCGKRYILFKIWVNGSLNTLFGKMSKMF